MYTFIQIADTLIRFANAFIICSRFHFLILLVISLCHFHEGVNPCVTILGCSRATAQCPLCKCSYSQEWELIFYAVNDTAWHGAANIRRNLG